MNLNTNYSQQTSDLVELSNGNVVVAFDTKDMYDYGSYSHNQWEIKGQIFDMSGTTTTTTTTQTETVTTYNTTTSTTTSTSSTTEVVPAISLASGSGASSSLTSIDTALQTLNSRRASLGALSNRLDHIVANNTNIATNIAKSISQIEDADFAAETTNLAKQQIISKRL